MTSDSCVLVLGGHSAEAGSHTVYISWIVKSLFTIHDPTSLMLWEMFRKLCELLDIGETKFAVR